MSQPPHESPESWPRQQPSGDDESARLDRQQWEVLQAGRQIGYLMQPPAHGLAQPQCSDAVPPEAVNHSFHILMSLFTCGIWFFLVYLWILIQGRKHHAPDNGSASG